MIKTIIVEDDPMVASINTQFAQKTPEIEFSGAFHNAADALAYLKENPVDLMLLDQYMPGAPA
jgi:response regulator of citrate/malate metabolism